MRDIKRIDRVIDKLKTLGKIRDPDQRFGQFISNLFGDIATKYKLNDLGWIEDQRESYGPKDSPVGEEILDDFIDKAKKRLEQIEKERKAYEKKTKR